MTRLPVRAADRADRSRSRAAAALALLAVLMFAGPAAAADGAGPAAIGSAYWSGFVDYWMGMLRRQDNIVMLVLGLGAVGIFIITRGKWKK